MPSPRRGGRGRVEVRPTPGSSSVRALQRWAEAPPTWATPERRPLLTSRRMEVKRPHRRRPGAWPTRHAALARLHCQGGRARAGAGGGAARPHPGAADQRPRASVHQSTARSPRRCWRSEHAKEAREHLQVAVETAHKVGAEPQSRPPRPRPRAGRAGPGSPRRSSTSHRLLLAHVRAAAEGALRPRRRRGGRRGTGSGRRRERRPPSRTPGRRLASG